MSIFSKKTWLGRVVNYPGRRKLTETETTGVYDVSREEGDVTQAGDGFTAGNMNDLEERIDSAVTTLQSETEAMPIIRTGTVTITPSAANTATSATVTFSTPFPGTPRISVTPQNSAAGTTLLGWAATGVSATGFTCWLTRSNTTQAILQWIAVYTP